MQSQRIVIALVTSTFLAACGTPVQVRRLLGGTKAEGAIYFLPKVLVRVKFAVNVNAGVSDKCAKIVSECRFELDKTSISLAELTIDRLTVPDATAGFVIRSNGGYLTQSSVTAEFNELAELTSTTGATSSKAAEIVASGLDGIAKIAKAIAMLGPNETAQKRGLSVRRRIALRAMLALLDDIDAKETAKSITDGNVEKRQKVRAAVNAELLELEKELTSSVVVPVTCLVEPDATTVAAKAGSDFTGSCTTYQGLKASLAAKGVDDRDNAWPALKVSFAPLTVLPEQRGAIDDWGALASTKGADSWVDGIVYRVPVWYRVSVANPNGPSAEEVVAIPQFGKLAAVTVKKSDLRGDKSLEVALHAGIGSLKKVEFKATPRSAEMVKGLTDAAASLLNVRKDADLQRLKDETDRLKAEKDKLEAQKALDAARKLP